MSGPRAGGSVRPITRHSRLIDLCLWVFMSLLLVKWLLILGAWIQ